MNQISAVILHNRPALKEIRLTLAIGDRYPKERYQRNFLPKGNSLVYSMSCRTLKSIRHDRPEVKSHGLFRVIGCMSRPLARWMLRCIKYCVPQVFSSPQPVNYPHQLSHCRVPNKSDAVDCLGLTDSEFLSAIWWADISM